MHIAPSFPNLSVLLIDASPHYRRIVRTMLYQAQLHRIFEAAVEADIAATRKDFTKYTKSTLKVVNFLQTAKEVYDNAKDVYDTVKDIVGLVT